MRALPPSSSRFVKSTLNAVVRHVRRWPESAPSRGRLAVRGLVAGSCIALVSLAAFWVSEPSLESLRAGVLVSVLVPLALTDLIRGLLPNAIVGPAGVLGLVLSSLADPSGWWTYPASALAVGSGLLAVALAYPGGMGMGDVKMSAMLGAFLGPYAALAVFLGASLGAACGGVLLLCGAMKRGNPLPFGVFMACGALLALFLGPEIWVRYLDFAAGD